MPKMFFTNFVQKLFIFFAFFSLSVGSVIGWPPRRPGSPSTSPVKHGNAPVVSHGLFGKGSQPASPWGKTVRGVDISALWSAGHDPLQSSRNRHGSLAPLATPGSSQGSLPLPLPRAASEPPFSPRDSLASSTDSVRSDTSVASAPPALGTGVPQPFEPAITSYEETFEGVPRDFHVTSGSAQRQPAFAQFRSMPPVAAPIQEHRRFEAPAMARQSFGPVEPAKPKPRRRRKVKGPDVLDDLDDTDLRAAEQELLKLLRRRPDYDEVEPEWWKNTQPFERPQPEQKQALRPMQLSRVAPKELREPLSPDAAMAAGRGLADGVRVTDLNNELAGNLQKGQRFTLEEAQALAPALIAAQVRPFEGDNVGFLVKASGVPREKIEAFLVDRKGERQDVKARFGQIVGEDRHAEALSGLTENLHKAKPEGGELSENEFANMTKGFVEQVRGLGGAEFTTKAGFGVAGSP